MNDVLLRLLLGLARKISLHATVHLELLPMSPLNDQVWVGSKLYTVLAQYGTIISLDLAAILFFFT